VLVSTCHGATVDLIGDHGVDVHIHRIFIYIYMDDVFAYMYSIPQVQTKLDKANRLESTDVDTCIMLDTANNTVR